MWSDIRKCPPAVALAMAMSDRRVASHLPEDASGLEHNGVEREMKSNWLIPELAFSSLSSFIFFFLSFSKKKKSVMMLKDEISASSWKGNLYHQITHHGGSSTKRLSFSQAKADWAQKQEEWPGNVHQCERLAGPIYSWPTNWRWRWTSKRLEVHTNYSTGPVLSI